MCGIAGFMFSDPARRAELETLKSLGRCIAHRGPDAEGYFQQPGVGIVHRRLSIIDLTTGDQPVSNVAGNVTVLFNGEIYNFRELRGDLIKRGHHFRTSGDTEVIAHLYEEHGLDFVQQLRGMFAISLWDHRQKKLLLARDRLGIKPLYFIRNSQFLVFASELKAILAFPGVPRELDPAALDDYLSYGFVPGPRTIFRHINKLAPGHFMQVSFDQFDTVPHRYWQLKFEADDSVSLEDWQEAIRHKIAEAVRVHMIADVPVGAFLSGGIDSTVVVANATAVAGRLQTFSIGFDDESSELPMARKTAEYFGTHHHEHVVHAQAAELLDELTCYFDEPFADSSALPTFLVSKMAREHVKVALSGDGGDEAFGGYRRYAIDLREAAIRRRLPRIVQQGLRPIASVWPKADWLPRPLRLKSFLTNVSSTPGDAYANTLQICRQPKRQQLLSRDVADQLNGHRSDAIVSSAHGAAPADDDLAGMIAADMATMLPDDYLVKADRASMAHGLEVRPPLLDHELLELSTRIPSRYKVHGGETKWILKRALAKQMPPGLLQRRKQGFEAPIDSWLRGPLRDMFESAVLARNHRIAELINQDTAASLYQSHRTGNSRNGAVLWSLLVLARWCDRYMPAPGASH